ncbi:MAG: hypothetical protein U0R80_12970 [Nocardioidaceae bacterium]
MPRRVSLPTADDLFRPTDDTAEAKVVRAVPDQAPEPAVDDDQLRRRPSGRVRHDEKMTVYVTSAELLHLEQARLALRADHGLAVDRGRLVREALSLVLAEFEEQGDESALVRRLTEE